MRLFRNLKPKEALKQSNPKRISDLMILGVKVDFYFRPNGLA
jgi:hypothetical protein